MSAAPDGLTPDSIRQFQDDRERLRRIAEAAHFAAGAVCLQNSDLAVRVDELIQCSLAEPGSSQRLHWSAAHGPSVV